MLTVTGGTINENEVDLNSVLRAEIASDIRADGRAHTRFLHVMDRVYLSEYTEQTATVGEKAGQLNLGSHTPVPQPWGPPTRTQ